MYFKLFLILSLALFATIQQGAAKDSFNVLQSDGLERFEVAEAVYFAEQARALHGSNALTKVATSMKNSLINTHGFDWSCSVSIGKPSATIFYFKQFIYLRSDTTDNMYIICFKTPYDYKSGSTVQLIL